MRATLAVSTVLLATAPVASEPLLGFPVDCSLGKTCYIQHYVDRDPGSGSLDFRCGHLTYDTHKGTDIAVPTLSDMRLGVNVLAAAPGTVTGLRDGMADIGLSDNQDAQIEGRECGNGVVLRHEDGWETQYCHMKSGSVLVQKGQTVERGDVLGQVGLSGRTQFPHLHLSVRKNGSVVDPFDLSDGSNCGKSPTNGLWINPIPYAPGGMIAAGFANSVPDYRAVTDGTAGLESLARNAPALVVYGLAFGGRAGDIVTLEIVGPEGPVLNQSFSLEKDQARYYRAAGKRAGDSSWPSGLYSGTVILTRDGREIDRIETEIATGE